MTVSAGGSVITNLPFVTTRDGQVFTTELASPTGEITGLKVRTAADPFIDYFFGVKNTTNSVQTYTFTFSSPYIDGPYAFLSTSHSDSASDSSNALGVPDGQVVIGVPSPWVYVHQPTVDSVLVGGINPGCTLNTGVGGSGSCVGFSDLVVPVTTGANGVFTIEVNFTLTPGDVYSLNGRAELFNQVPEPGSALLFLAGTGLIGLGTFLRRR